MPHRECHWSRWLVQSIWVGCCALLLLTAFAAPAPAADERKPLTIVGKRSLYQRVLARTGAALRREPNPAALEVVKLTPMMPLYVFASRMQGGVLWLELGAGVSRPDGWLPAEQTMAWNQTLTAIIEKPVKRHRVLFFRRDEDLERLHGSPGASDEIAKLIDAADRGLLPPNSPVIACEPPEPPGEQQFYVQPILEVKDFVRRRESAQFLRVAVETLQGASPLIHPDQPTRAQTVQASNPEKSKEMRTAVIFVLDTTVSMTPYIDRVRQSVRALYQRLVTLPYGNKIAFGVVAFRSDVGKAKELGRDLGYNTQVFSKLRTPRDSATFFAELDKVVATDVSSDEFNEDALAGIKVARDMASSSEYQSIYIVLVTDAGTKEGIKSSSGESVTSMRRMADDKRPSIAIATMHLLTPAGARNKNHDSARQQYQILNKYGEIGTYFPIKDGSVEEFGPAVDGIVDAVRRSLEQTDRGEAITAPPPTESAKVEAPIVETIRSRMALIGRSMQLQYLGQVVERQAPRVVEAWISDRDPGSRSANSVTISALITKNQLDQIARAIDQIKQKGEETRGRSNDFFSQLRTISSIGLRNPSEVNIAKIERLAELGGVDEYIDGLPYLSELLTITEARWISMRASEQREFLDRLDINRRNYAEYMANAKWWTDIEGTPGNTGDDVMQIPLEALP